MGMGQLGNYSVPPGYRSVAAPMGNSISYPVINLPKGGMISAIDHFQATKSLQDNRPVSALEMVKQFAKGLVSPVTSLFKSPKSFLMGMGLMATSAALLYATAGAAAPLLLGVGVGLGLFQAGASIYKLVTARNSQEFKDACYQAGAAVGTLGLSSLGAKQSLSWASKLSPEKIDSMTTLNAVAENIKSIPSSLSKSFSAFKNRQAYSNLKTGLSATKNLFRPTTEQPLKNIADLVSEIEKHKVRAVMLDWDNTVMAIGEKELRPETVKALKALQKLQLQNGDKKVQIGIVSNNPFRGRINYAQKVLSENGIDIPIVWDSVKPSKAGYTRMFEVFKDNDSGLTDFSQVAMVGDGLINDMVGGNRLNMKTIHAKWFKIGIAAKTKACFFDMVGHIVNPIIRLFSSHSKAEYFPAVLKTSA